MAAGGKLGLGIEITADDMASGRLRGVGKASDGLKGRLANLGAAATKIFGGIVASIGTVKAAFSFVEPFAQFEKGLTAVSSIALGGQENMEGLRDAAIQAGLDTQFSPKEAVDGLLDLATAGQTAQQAIKTLNPVLDLASASMGQLGVSGSATAVVGTLNSFGLEAGKAGMVADKLTKITQLSNFQMRDFEAGLAKAAAAGGIFEQSMDTTLITLGLLRNRNIDASSAATGYREALRRLASDQRAQSAVTDQGVDIFDKQTGEMRDLVDIMLDFKDATGEMTKEKRNAAVADAFGARGMLAYGAVAEATFTTIKDGQEVVLKGSEAIGAMRVAMSKADGTAGSFRDKMLATFDGQVTLLKGSLETLQIVSGEGLAKTLQPFVTGFIESINDVIKFIKEMSPEMRDQIGKVIAIFLGLVVVGGVIAVVVGAFSLLGGTVAAIAAGVVAVGAVLGQFYADATTGGEEAQTTFAGLKAFAMDLWAGLKQIGQNLVAFFGGFREGFSETVEFMRPTINAFVAALEKLRIALAGSAGTQDDWASSGKSAGKAIAAAIGVVIRIVTLVIEAFIAFSDAVGGITDAFDPLIQAFRDAANEIKPLLVEMGILNGEGDTMAAIFQMVGGTLGYVFSNGVKAAATAVRGIAGALKGIIIIVQGVIDVLGGIMDGDWGRIWEGAKQIFVGFARAIVAVFASSVQLIAESIDKAAGLVGKESNLGASVEGFKNNMLSSLDASIGAVGDVDLNQDSTSLPPAPAGDGIAKIDEILNNLPSDNAPAPIPLPEDRFSAAGKMAEDMAAATAAAAAEAAVKAKPPGVTRATLNVDGQVLGEIVAKHGADADNASGVPVDINAS